jgi:hypothetical protein
MPLGLFDHEEVDAPEFAAVDTARLMDRIHQLRDDKIELAIIKTPGRDRSTRAAAMALPISASSRGERDARA